MEVRLVTEPVTQAPDTEERYVAVETPDGEERWLRLASDAEDVDSADFDLGFKWSVQLILDLGWCVW